ncbi:MAG TPA: VWA domain-containing protein [Burkholderiaceae bacterium]|nr:VWA domain-containing protein [Burkholderiaceae bacterium]
MNYEWPEMLWLMLLVPLCVLLYVWLLKRRRQMALRYSGLSMVRAAMGQRSRWRRHLPAALMLLALASLLYALARPQMRITTPSNQKMIVLAMDVSGSMRATDVQPSRMEAAQAAAREFIKMQPASTRIGIVTFAGTAALVQPPTYNKDDLFAAIDRFKFQRATAVGSGILVSLQAIFPDIEFDLRGSNPRVATGDPREGQSLDDMNKRPSNGKQQPKPVEPGSYTSAAIVLLTDGQTTTGPNPIESARMAAERGVRVYTVGIGTENGDTLIAEGWSMRVRLDEESLRTIANLTGAQYFYAGTAKDLQKIYQDLHSKLGLETRETEVTAMFAGIGAVLMLLGAGLSVLWFNRVL